jgi:hypothetical protein
VSIKPLDERIPVWLAALEAGYLSADELVWWADEEICRSSAPPLWLPDLCLARTPGDVEALLGPAWSRHQVRDPSCIVRAADPRSLTLGFVWLSYERGGRTLADVLRTAARVNGSYGFEDEDFTCRDLSYDLTYGRPDGSPADVEAEARAMLAGAAREARTRMDDLPRPGSA